jgi:transcriptional regulator with XRE-family HTH domain
MERLKAFLTEGKMTQRELASELGFSEEYVSRLMNGKVPVTKSLIGAFIYAFGVAAAAEVFEYPELPPSNGNGADAVAEAGDDAG